MTTTTQTHTLGQYLTAARHTTTIREVGRRTRLAEGTIRNYEADRVNRPVPATVAKIARVVKADVAHALELAGFRAEQYPDLTSDHGNEVVDAFDEWFHEQSTRDRGRILHNLIDLHASLASLEG